MRLIIEMSDAEHNDLKVFAAQKKMTMRQVVLKSVNIFMGNPDNPIKPIKRERYDQFIDILKRSGLNNEEAAYKMDMEIDDFMDLVERRKKITGDVLCDTNIFLTLNDII